MQVQTYLTFHGRCEEALEFYKKALAAEVKSLHRFQDAPQAPPDGIPGEKVMHAEVRIGETTLLASDGQCQGDASFQGFSLALAPRDEAEARRLFDALSDGGQVQMPLAKTFFSPAFGMVTDRFGVAWMIHVTP